MIATIARKEWKEHRTRYLAYSLLLNSPILLVTLLTAMSAEARVPFAGASNATVLQYLPLALLVSVAVPTLFLFLTSSLAVAMFNRQAESGAAFLLHEQPISRASYATSKLVVGGGLVVAATTFAILLAVAVAWLLLLAGGKVSWSGSSAQFWLVFAAAGRASVWGALISLGVFAGSALVAAISPRWWIAALGSIAFTAAILSGLGDFFDFTPDIEGSAPISISADFHLGVSKPWITMSRPLLPMELQAFAPWKPAPLLLAVALTVLFSWLLRLIYQRGDVYAELPQPTS